MLRESASQLGVAASAGAGCTPGSVGVVGVGVVGVGVVGVGVVGVVGVGVVGVGVVGVVGVGVGGGGSAGAAFLQLVTATSAISARRTSAGIIIGRR